MLKYDAEKRINSLDLKNHIETINLNEDLENFNENLIVNNINKKHTNLNLEFKIKMQSNIKNTERKIYFL